MIPPVPTEGEVRAVLGMLRVRAEDSEDEVYDEASALISRLWEGWKADKAKLAEARKVIAELTDELSAEVENHYKDTKNYYPGEQRRYERDMAPVVAGRSWLAKQDTDNG